MDRHSQRRLTARQAMSQAPATASQPSGPLKAVAEGKVLQKQAHHRDVEPIKAVRADRALAPAKDRARRDAEPAVVPPVVPRHRPVGGSTSTATTGAFEEAPQSAPKEPRKVEWLTPAAVVIAAVISVIGGFRTTVRAAEINAQALVQVAEINARAVDRAAEFRATQPPAPDQRFVGPMYTESGSAQVRASRVQYLRVDEVAVIFRVDRKTVYRLIASKRLRAVHLGRVVRIPADALPR
jgi:excisionase family DNA binding protein